MQNCPKLTAIFYSVAVIHLNVFFNGKQEKVREPFFTLLLLLVSSGSSPCICFPSYCWSPSSWSPCICSPSSCSLSVSVSALDSLSSPDLVAYMLMVYSFFPAVTGYNIIIIIIKAASGNDGPSHLLFRGGACRPRPLQAFLFL